MNPNPIARYLQRLPTFITFFFSVMLVAVFNHLAAIFNWTTGPTFDIRNGNDDLIVVSFLATLFFVVSVWLAFSLLIERFPYTLDYTMFFFDVVRFSVLFMIYNFAFLAGNPPYYWYYIVMLGVFHLLMAGWHTYRLRAIQREERVERIADIRGHLIRVGSYFLLAIIYIVLVTVRWQETQPFELHAILVIITSALVVYWNVLRLLEVKAKAVKAQRAAEVSQTQEAAKTKPAAVPASQ
jgi:hypothetical protein